MPHKSKQINEILTRGVSEIIDQKRVEDKLNSGKPLRVKFGIDPTGVSLHLGHTVNLWKLRQFQEAGHIAVIIIGDYTASIGDPSGKDKTRPHLTKEEIQKNYEDYERQALSILSKDNLEIRMQSEWFGEFSLEDVIRLTSTASVSEVLSHETFKNRLESNSPFSTHEILYPFLQGYDSVAIDSDIELGATEQKFNLLMGRAVQRAYGKEPQDVMMSPYLLGTDGKEKMSKSLDNYIGLQDEPYDMFGKVMSMTDNEIPLYFEMVTSIDFDSLDQYKNKTGKEARDAKLVLAKTIVETFYGKEKAQEAENNFIDVFQKGETGEAAKKVVLSQKEYTLADILVESELASSKNEAKRRIEEGSVYIDDKKQEDPFEKVLLSKSSQVIRIGKRKIASITCK